MGITIGSDYSKKLQEILVQTLGLTATTAEDIVEDHKISGIELWSRFLALGEITKGCGSQKKASCLISYGREFFAKKVNQALNQAAGTDGVLNSPAEVGTLKNLLESLVRTQRGQNPGVVLKDDYDLSQKVVSVRERLKDHWKLGGPDVKKLTESRPSAPQYHSVVRKNRDQPNTITILSYLGPETGLSVSIEGIFDLIVRHMPNFDDWTSFYEEIHVIPGRGGLPNTSERQGEFVVETTLNLPGFSAPRLETQVDWVKLGPESGANQGAFVMRFSRIPGTSESSWGIDCLALEGTVIARPVSEGGVLIELELDFDLSNIPNWALNMLTGAEVGKFVSELARASVQLLRTDK